jgi:uncharacterized protein (DUF1330 family)
MKKKQLNQLKNIKHKKHNSIVDDYETQKQKHIEKLGTKMLDNQNKVDRLKQKNINKNILNLF